MGARKGCKPPPNAGKGRAKGVPNKATANAREAIAAFVEGHTLQLDQLLAEIRQSDGPMAAWRCIMDMVEYHVPKLARTEVTGKDGGPVAIAQVVDELHP